MLLFTIITLTLNRDRYIKACLDSVLSQSCKDYEHIIIDSKSTDRTLQFVGEYMTQTNKCFLHTSAPLGIANSMNYGLEKAKGTYVVFLHSDDWFYNKSTLEYVKNFILQTRKDAVFGPKTMQFGKFIINLRLLNVLSNYQICNVQKYWNFIPHSSLFMKTQLIRDAGGFDAKYKYAMDYDLWCRTLTKDNFAMYDKPTVVFRRHKSSASFKAGNTLEVAKEIIGISRHYFAQPRKKGPGTVSS